MFEPKDRAEAEIFALEGLRADVQYEILRVMREAGISKGSLARQIGVSAARVSQLLDDDANLTLESIAKVFVALGRKPRFGSESKEADIQSRLHDQIAKVITQEHPLDGWMQTRERELKPKKWGGGPRPSQVLGRRVPQFNEVFVGINDNFAERRIGEKQAA